MIIVVGYTPTPLGQSALLAGIEETQARGGSLVVLNTPVVMPSVTPVTPSRPTSSGCARRARKPAWSSASARIRGREPSEELVDLLHEVNAGLCVIGIRRRTAVGKMLLGSNANRILMDAPCHVLAVKPTDHHE